jgi:magnesium transporter
VLQELAPQSAAAFLAEIAPALAATVVAEMSSWSAARCLAHMDAARMALVLAAILGPQATHLLRLLEPCLVGRVLGELPSAVAAAYERSMSFPAGSVGAWTDHSMPVFREHDAAQRALDWLREAHAAALSHVFVADEHLRLIGSVPVSALLGASRRAVIAQLMRRPAPYIALQLPLDAAAKSPSWDEYLVLPVLDERGVVIGGLTRSAVRRGLESGHRPARRAERSIIAQLLEALVAALHGITVILLQGTERRP